MPCRTSTDELLGPRGLEQAEAEEMIGLVAELADLWDVAFAAGRNDSQTSRFGPEGRQEPFIEGVKRLTMTPVVGVGRYASPDWMASIVRKGTANFIGAARPSIADPFLPKKIEEGRIEGIRECIGCNICASGDFSISLIRCTQNPTMGEEWRKGWHPERIRARESDRPILVVGAGPAGSRRPRPSASGATWPDVDIESVTTIGDALASATIAHAVYAGRRYAEELGGPPQTGDEVSSRGDLP